MRKTLHAAAVLAISTLVPGLLSACGDGGGGDGAGGGRSSGAGGSPDAALQLPDAESGPDATVCVDCDALAFADLRPLDAAPAPVCVPGTFECEAPADARTCDASGAWQPTPCGPGEVCNNGTCVCLPGTGRTCASPFDRVVCQADGTDALEPCPDGLWCSEGRCIEAMCGSNDDCHSDTVCLDGRCLPYLESPANPSASECRTSPVVGDFSPEVQCRWTGGQVSGQVIAIDLDGDGVPSIIFASAGNLIAIRGDDCTEERRTMVGPAISNESSPAAGDVDGDGSPDVVGVGIGLLYVFDENLELKYTAGTVAGGLASAPAIADLDGDGRPEIVSGATAINGEDGSLHGRGAEPPLTAYGPIPAIADVDGDGRQEVLYGNRLYDAFMNDVTPDAMRRLQAGHIAVADFDLASPGPEIAVVGGQTHVRVQRIDGTVIFGPYQVPGSMWAGGAPNIGDFDGDGEPEIGTAGSSNYAVFDFDCVGDPAPEGCVAPGTRWLRETRDGSSGCTGSTTFDFEGDGRTEVVYNDECFLRVYDGATGDVLLALANTTGTLIEAPIVADVDGDYNTEIIMGSDEGFPCNAPDPDTGTQPRQTFGVTVLRDVTDRWVHSRPIWNQNAYDITNVENDGHIPAHPQPNWETFNSFRENAQPRDKALEAPDLTVRGEPVEAADCGAMTLSVVVHNRGSQPVSRGLPVLFFDGDPANGGAEFCRTETTQRLAPAEGETVTCTWGARPEAGGLVFVYVDAAVDGVFSENTTTECAEQNNFTALRVPPCR
jgi:hypothetical protein